MCMSAYASVSSVCTFVYSYCDLVCVLVCMYCILCVCTLTLVHELQMYAQVCAFNNYASLYICCYPP